jgi:hypothetical protein
LPAGFTRYIVGVPKAESDAVLAFLFHQIGENPDFQVRFHWEPSSVAFWDNRVRGFLSLSLSLSLSLTHTHTHTLSLTCKNNAAARLTFRW